MPEQEHVRPLAPAAVRPMIDRATSAGSPKNNLRRRNRIRCFGCVAAAALFLIAIAVILAFTVFRVKDPIIEMNGVTITRLDVVNGTQIPRPGTNISMVVDVSVKNPNTASFRYRNTTTEIYYRGTVVGEARGPPGKARAQRTMRMNLTVDIMTDRLLSISGLGQDVGSGLLNMSSYSRVGGRVKILGIVKRHVTVKMNCTMAVNVTRQAIQEQKCRKKVEL